MSHPRQWSLFKTTARCPPCQIAAIHANNFLEIWSPECTRYMAKPWLPPSLSLITSHDRCRHPPDLLLFTLRAHENNTLNIGSEGCSLRQHGASTAFRLHKSGSPNVGPANHHAARQAALQGRPHPQIGRSHAFVHSLHNGIHDLM